MAYTRSPTHTLQALSLLLPLAAMVAVNSSSAPSSVIRLELNHVDAKGGFTKPELIRRAMNRTRLRSAMLQGMQQADGTTDPTTPFTTYSHIVSTAHISDQEYLMELAVAGKPFSAGADTGSDVIWIEKDLCRPNQPTASTVPCCSKMCKRIPKPKGGVPCTSDNKCKYSISYGGGTARTEGVLMRDEGLTLLSNTAHKPLVHIPGVAIGCSSITPPNSKGIVGLGRGPQSLLAQLGFGKFSYCLNSYENLNQPSALLFGAVPDLDTGCASSATPVATTPLLQLRHDPSKYYVHLEGISIGSVRLRIPEKALEPYGRGAGNMFIDTGCSYSIMAKAIRDAIINHMDDVDFLTRRKDRNDREVCYQVSQGKTPGEMPHMVLHFAGGADMNLKWEQYTLRGLQEDDDSCLAFDTIEWNKEYSILGNYQQHNTRMLIDTIEGSVSFVPADCSKF